MAGLVLQNDVSGPPTFFADWARARGLPYELTIAPDERIPDDPTRYDWLLLLGSPSSATDTDVDWIAAELELTRQAVQAEVPVLGICFGGQMLSLALGGEIRPAIGGPGSLGWLATRTRREDLVAVGPWIYLNHERFSVPDGAELVAESVRGAAAFVLGPHLGLQFHPEVPAAVAEGWAATLTGLLADAELTIEEFRSQGREHGVGARDRAFTLFDAWRAAARF